MSNEHLEDNPIAVENLNNSAQALGKAILNSEAYINFIKSRDKFRIDEPAKEAARVYNTIVSDYQKRAQWGGNNTNDDTLLEETRKKAMENKVLSDYHIAQDNLIRFYIDLNTYLSDKLKFNFAALAKPAGGCCC